MIKKYILLTFFFMGLAVCLSSCSEEKLDPKSIFDTEESELDPKSASYKFDKWLLQNYLQPYNLQFKYKMQDIGSDMDYNLVPATYNKSIDLAVLAKYLWFDVYAKVVDDEFLKYYGPRIIHLIGSPAYNPANGTIVLGTAEGGLKVTLYTVNTLDPSDFNMLNLYYFKTMHHEFAHILHQTKTYPREFNMISTKYYTPMGWERRTIYEVASLGFTSSYASSEAREDFVETIANYVTMTEEEWIWLLDIASKDWTFKEGSNTPIESAVSDGVDGKAVILEKLSIAREWFKEAWNIDIDALRAEVQERQMHIDIEALRSEVENMK